MYYYCYARMVVALIIFFSPPSLSLNLPLNSNFWNMPSKTHIHKTHTCKHTHTHNNKRDEKNKTKKKKWNWKSRGRKKYIFMDFNDQLYFFFVWERFSREDFFFFWGRGGKKKPDGSGEASAGFADLHIAHFKSVMLFWKVHLSHFHSICFFNHMWTFIRS